MVVQGPEVVGPQWCRLAVLVEVWAALQMGLPPSSKATTRQPPTHRNVRSSTESVRAVLVLLALWGLS